jgi:hypothetical protein
MISNPNMSSYKQKVSGQQWPVLIDPNPPDLDDLTTSELWQLKRQFQAEANSMGISAPACAFVDEILETQLKGYRTIKHIIQEFSSHHHNFGLRIVMEILAFNLNVKGSIEVKSRRFPASFVDFAPLSQGRVKLMFAGQSTGTHYQTSGGIEELNSLRHCGYDFRFRYFDILIKDRLTIQHLLSPSRPRCRTEQHIDVCGTRETLVEVCDKQLPLDWMVGFFARYRIPDLDRFVPASQMSHCLYYCTRECPAAVQLVEILDDMLRAQVRDNLWCCRENVPDEVIPRLGHDVLVLNLGRNIGIGRLLDFTVLANGSVSLDIESADGLVLTWQELIFGQRLRFDLHFVDGICRHELFPSSLKSKESSWSGRISPQAGKALGIGCASFVEVERVDWQKTIAQVMREDERVRPWKEELRRAYENHDFSFLRSRTDYLECCLTLHQMLRNRDDVPRPWEGVQHALKLTTCIIREGVQKEIQEASLVLPAWILSNPTDSFAEIVLGLLVLNIGAPVSVSHKGKEIEGHLEYFRRRPCGRYELFIEGSGLSVIVTERIERIPFLWMGDSRNSRLEISIAGELPLFWFSYPTVGHLNTSPVKNSASPGSEGERPPTEFSESSYGFPDRLGHLGICDVTLSLTE